MNDARGIRTAAALLSFIADYSASDFLAAGELLVGNSILSSVIVGLVRFRQQQEAIEKRTVEQLVSSEPTSSMASPDRLSERSTSLRKSASNINRSSEESLNATMVASSQVNSNLTPRSSLSNQFESWFYKNITEFSGELFSHPHFLTDGVITRLKSLTQDTLLSSSDGINQLMHLQNIWCPSNGHPISLKGNSSKEYAINELLADLEAHAPTPQEVVRYLVLVLQTTLTEKTVHFFQFAAITVAAIYHNRIMFTSSGDILNLSRLWGKNSVAETGQSDRLSISVRIVGEAIRSAPSSSAVDLLSSICRLAISSPVDGPMSILNANKSRTREKK